MRHLPQFIEETVTLGAIQLIRNAHTVDYFAQANVLLARCKSHALDPRCLVHRLLQAADGSFDVQSHAVNGRKRGHQCEAGEGDEQAS
jgi:hypothetical protein